MGIRIKYDPVGALFLGSYATGVAQGQDRRRREMLEQAQRMAAMQQQSRERAMDRAVDVQRDFNRHNIKLGNVGPIQPGIGGAIAQGRLADAGLVPNPQGDVFVDRRAWEQQQRQQQGQEEDWLRLVDRDVNMEVPVGVQANQPAAKEYGVLRESLRKARSDATIDSNLSEYQEGIQKIRDKMAKIREDNQRDEVALANQDVMYWDTKDKRFHPDAGDPTLGRQPYSKTTRMPIETQVETEEKKAEKEAEKQQQAVQQKALDAQRGVAADALKRRLKAIDENDDPKVTAKKKLEDSQAAWEEYNKTWGPGGTAYQQGTPEQPAAAPPPAGQPGAVAPAPTQGTGVSPEVEEMRQRMGFTNPPSAPAQQQVIPSRWEPSTPEAQAVGKKGLATGGKASEHVPITNAPDMQSAQLAEKFLPHPSTMAEAMALGSGAIFVDPEGKIRRVP